MTDHDDIHRRSRDLFDRRSVRATLFLIIPAAIFVLVCVGIRVSQLGIDHTIVVIGQDRLVAGSPAAVRITLIADSSGYFLPDRVDAELVRGGSRHRLFGGAIDEDGYALARNFEVPDVPPGPAEVELDIGFDERRRVVRCRVEVVGEPPPERLLVLDDARPGETPVRVDRGGDLVQALTEDRGAPTGLTSVLFFRVQGRDGAPRSVPLEIAPPATGDEPAAMEKIVTDRLGLSAWAVRPADLDYPVLVAGARPTAVPGAAAGAGPDGGAEGEEDPGFLYPRVVYSGLSVSVHNPIVQRGEPLRMTVHQITRGGPVYVDLFREGRWVFATSAWADADGKAEFRINPPCEGLLRAQITNSALVPGRTIGVRHVLALGDGQDLNDGLRAVLGRLRGPVDGPWARAVSAMDLEGGARFDRGLAAAFALSRLYEGHQEVGRLVSSRKEDDAELRVFRARVQRGVMLVILLLGVAVALLIGTVAAAAFRRRQRMESEIMSEATGTDETGGAPEDDAEARWSRRRMIVQGSILFFILVGAFAAIALLVDTMTWGR